MVTVTVFGEDTSFDGRIRFRDAVVAALKPAGLGEHFGGGSWVTDEKPSYNIEFLVTDPSQALTIIRDALRAASVGQATELMVGQSRYNVYDDSWTDLGPRQRPAHTPAADRFAGMSGGDFLANLQKITDDARKKYGGPKDPDRGA